jgi:hypothetical protein
MSMILGGIVQGLGQGISAQGQAWQQSDALYARLQQAKELSDMQFARTADTNDTKLEIARLRLEQQGAAAAAKAGKGGSNPDNITDDDSINELAGLENQIGGKDVKAIRGFARTGDKPTAEQHYERWVNPQAGADDDPVEREHNDATRLVVDPAFDALYQGKSKDVAASIRKSKQSKEYKSLVEGDGERQSQGLIGAIASGADNADDAAAALLAKKGNGRFSDGGVDSTNGDTNDLAVAKIGELNAKAQSYRADAADTASGKIKPKDMVDYIKTQTVGINQSYTELRQRENAANGIAKDPLASKEQKAQAAEDLKSIRDARVSLDAAKADLSRMSSQVANGVGINTGNAPEQAPKAAKQGANTSVNGFNDPSAAQRMQANSDAARSAQGLQETARMMKATFDNPNTSPADRADAGAWLKANGINLPDKAALRAESDRQKKQAAADLAGLEAQRNQSGTTGKPSASAIPVSKGDIVASLANAKAAINGGASREHVIAKMLAHGISMDQIKSAGI